MIHNSGDEVSVGIRGMSEEDKRSVGISTISVVTRLALEFDQEEVSRFRRLAYSWRPTKTVLGD
jgi:hypothetical protein